MKIKINTVIFGFLLVNFNVFSQELGIKGGLNFPISDAIASITAKDISQTVSSGYHAGVFAKFKFAVIAINPEIQYSFQSIDYQGALDAANPSNLSDISQKSAYVDIPIMLRFYLPAGLNFQVGPQFSYLMSAKKVSDDLSADVDIQELLTNSNISINLGLGFDLPFGLDVYGRYNIGISDINDPSTASNAIQNSMIQVSLAYSLKK